MTPEDLKGLRMRATDKGQANYLKAWGANTVVIPWPEIYNSLQTGVADGYLNPAIVPTLFKHTEVIKHFSDVKAGAPLRVAIASEAWYSKLSDKDRAVVDQAVLKANQANRQWLAGLSKMSFDALEKAGVQVTHPSPEQRALFAKAARAIYPDMVPRTCSRNSWRRRRNTVPSRRTDNLPGVPVPAAAPGKDFEKRPGRET